MGRAVRMVGFTTSRQADTGGVMGQGRQQRGIRREWTVLREEHASEGEFRAAVQQAMLDLDAIGARLGGSFAQVPLRHRIADAEFETVGWRFRWESFAPYLPDEEQPEPVADDDLEPVDEPAPEPVEA